MNKPWENESCEEIFSYLSLYPVHYAAALWCGIPAGEIQKFIDEASRPQRGIYSHPKVKCLEGKCRVIHNAIDSGALPVCRGNGVIVTDHVAPERRHVSRQHLKDWIAKEFPGKKPAFLFDELERKTHSAISADSFHALQVDRDATQTENAKLRKLNTDLTQERDALLSENKSIKATLEQHNVPDIRSEATYLNIIGKFLGLMLSKSPSGQSHSAFSSQAAIIDALLAHFPNIPGITKRTLEEKFSRANQSLKSN
jgi:FtsZ-binding cell division protein ZapB